MSDETKVVFTITTKQAPAYRPRCLWCDTPMRRRFHLVMTEQVGDDFVDTYEWHGEYMQYGGPFHSSWCQGKFATAAAAAGFRREYADAAEAAAKTAAEVAADVAAAEAAAEAEAEQEQKDRAQEGP
jgi:hypothetical protein